MDPFLFCAHHQDHYPVGTKTLGVKPEALVGRKLGMDFESKDGFRMYHGSPVPGFPAHPHRGFETVTLVQKGYCDHADSLGASARFGEGDAQWVTTGSGVVHSEMFPLLNEEEANPLELFQIWLNLPSKDKMAPAHFSLFWSSDIPKVLETDSQGREAEITLVAGELNGVRAPSPPPHSWAYNPAHDVAIWFIRLVPGRKWTLPPACAGTNRALYFYEGDSLQIDGVEFKSQQCLALSASAEVEIAAGSKEVKILLLQGQPIGEAVQQSGPFVMNTREELRQTIADYQATQFGGWPWSSPSPLHPPGQGRFAQYGVNEVKKLPPR